MIAASLEGSLGWLLIMLVFGLNASESVSSEISELFTGQPSDRAMWMMIGGGILAALGVGAFFLPKRA